MVARIAQVNLIKKDETIVSLTALNADGAVLHSYKNEEEIKNGKKYKHILGLVTRKNSRFTRQACTPIGENKELLKEVYANEKIMELICVDFFGVDGYLGNIILNKSDYNASLLPVPVTLYDFDDAHLYLEQFRKPVKYPCPMASPINVIKGEYFDKHEMYRQANRIELITTTYY